MRPAAAVVVIASISLLAFAQPAVEQTEPASPGWVSAEPIPDADRRAGVAFEEKLDRPLTGLRFASDTTINEAVTAIAERLDVGLIVDEQALMDEGATSDDPAAIPAGDLKVSARTLLAQIMRPKNLAYRTETGVLFITTAAMADEHLSTRVYDVHDLLDGVSSEPLRRHARLRYNVIADRCFAPPLSEGEKAAAAAEAARNRDAERKDEVTPRSAAAQLVDLVEISTKGYWRDLDDSSGGGTAAIYDGMLVVRQNEENHAEVAALLRALRQVRASRPARAPNAPPDR